MEYKEQKPVNYDSRDRKRMFTVLKVMNQDKKDKHFMTYGCRIQ